MMRVLTLFAHLFKWHVFMLVFLTLGGVLLAAALIAGAVADEWDMLWPSLLLFLPPLMLAPVAFRQLVGNRHTALVPGFRYAALGALLLIPVIGALAGAALAALAPRAPETLGPLGIALGSFTLLTAYVLLWQWLCTFTAGSMAHLLLIFFLGRTLLDDPGALLSAIRYPWLAAGLAALAWFWLFGVLRTAARISPPARGIASWSDPSRQLDWITAWRPPQGRDVVPATALMRGIDSGWLRRTVNVLVLLVGTGAIGVAWFLLVMPQDPNVMDDDPALIFLWLSLLGVTNFAALAVCEWPLRLRYLWLRSRGDRASLWRVLEREIAGEMLIVTAIAMLCALGILAFSDVLPVYLIAYVAGCGLGGLWSCYLGCWMRITGTSPKVIAPVLVLCWGLVSWTVVFMVRAFPPPALLALLPVFAGLALHSRFRAKASFLRHDFCAVRPARRHRKKVPGTNF